MGQGASAYLWHGKSSIFNMDAEATDNAKNLLQMEMINLET